MRLIKMTVMKGWDGNMNLIPVLNAKTCLAFGFEWVHDFCVYQAVLQIFKNK